MEAYAGQLGVPGYWLCEGDFLSTDGCPASRLGVLGFPCSWPEVYHSSQVLRSLIGKKGTYPAGRVAVVGPPVAEDRSGLGEVNLCPWQSHANARRVNALRKLEVFEGLAILERRDEAPGTAFVALRWAWNVLPDGRWVDFTPWPSSWQQLLLAAPAGGSWAPKPKEPLGDAEVRLALQLCRLHGQQVPGDAGEMPPGAGAERDSGGELEALRQELALAVKEADAACAALRRKEAEVAQLRRKVAGNPEIPVCKKLLEENGAGGMVVGALVEIMSAEEATALKGEKAVVTSRDAANRLVRLRLRTGELTDVEERHLRLVDDAKDKPDLTTFGTEVCGTLLRSFGTVEYSLWPLIFSGFVRVRCPDHLVAKLNVQCDQLQAARGTPSHALFLQGEMKEGKQLTIQEPEPEYEALLLSCTKMLGSALIGDDDEGTRYVVDTVWTVHQMSGDYNPVHFHNNARSPYGFSSFLHLQLPPQVGERQNHGSEDGGTSFIWKTDTTATAGGLECPGVLSVEMQEGYLHVFPQWVQHFVWPFRGKGERRTIAANVARIPSGMRQQGG